MQIKIKVTYPTTIIDNFFDDPDAIVEMAEGMKYYAPDTGNYWHLEQNNYTLKTIASLHTSDKKYIIYFMIVALRLGVYNHISKHQTL